MNLVEKLIRLIYPPKCIFCGNILSLTTKIEICDACRSRIPFETKGNISFSGKLNFQTSSGIFYDRVIYLCEYSGIIKDAIIKYKFLGKSSFYKPLGKLLAEKLKKMTSTQDFDIIIGVPLHKTKEKIRGFNQAELMAKVIGKENGIREASQLLSRVVCTESQSKLGKAERFINVRGAFKANNTDAIKNKKVLLIDDIFTTGNTVNECSRVLKEAGATEVVAVVLASGRAKYN